MNMIEDTNAALAEIAERMLPLDNFVICGHVGPDGDCIGSQLTLYHALRAMGKHAVCVLVKDEPVNALFDFMPGVQDLIFAGSFKGRCDVFVTVDVSIRERIGIAAELLDRSSVSFAIDHHANDEHLCEYECIDPHAPSASVLVWELVKHLMPQPPFESAFCAYTGLLTDTGGFRFQNSTARAFEYASELVAYGVDPSQIATAIYQNRSLKSLCLEKLAIERMQMVSNGQGVLSWVTRADFEELDAQKSDAETLIDTIRSLRGVRVACMLREHEDFIRGSLRAKDSTDVAKVARTLNGGGHKAAAGFTLYMPLSEAIPFMQGVLDGLLSNTAEVE